MSCQSPAEPGFAADCQEPTLRFGPWQQLKPGGRLRNNKGRREPTFSCVRRTVGMSEDHPLPPPEPSFALEDIYTFGYSPTAVQIMTSRTAEDSARSFCPIYAQGCGCWIAAVALGVLP